MKYVVRKEEDKLFLWEIGEPTEHCTDGQTYIPSNKIGAVSPEATWVTEGMEFEEDEIFRCFVHENVSKLSDPMKREVQIKGPCGHFH